MAFGWAAWAMAGCLAIDAPRDAGDLSEFVPQPLRVESDGLTLDLPGGQQGRNYLLLLGAPQAQERGGLVRIDRASSAGPSLPLPTQTLTIDPDWLRRTRDRRDRMAARRAEVPEAPVPRPGQRFPPRQRFDLFTGDGDGLDPSQYRQVSARLMAVGEHCLVYADEADDPAVSAATVAEAVATFDRQVFPQARTRFGRHEDVNRDGKFTILFTRWLGKLSQGKVSLGGFVRGGDFHRDVPAPYSNQTDMLYLNSALQPGSHLRTLVAHEYLHAVTFTEHVFGEHLPGTAPQDEEAWLNEAISHLGENLLGQGWSNLDYRISAFLNAPNRYRLVVPDYYRAGLFRNHGCRGATYLMLRWSVDRYGEGLLRELVQSGACGTENLETGFGLPFAEMFRRWSLAVSLQGLATGGDAREQLPSAPLRGRLGGFLLAGPRTPTIEPGTQHVALAATSFVPLRVFVPPGGAARVRVEAPGLPLQATLVRLPDDLPLAELEAVTPLSQRAGLAPRSGADRRTVKLRHRAGGPVKWTHVSLERETPAPFREGEGVAPPQIVLAEEFFPKQTTVAGEALPGGALVPADWSGPVVLKAIGEDRHGRRVAAWGLCEPADPQVADRRATPR